MKLGRRSIADEIRAVAKTIPMNDELMRLADQVGILYEGEIHVTTCMAGSQGQHVHYRHLDASRTLCGKKVRFDVDDPTISCPHCRAAMSGSEDAA